jgi:diol dehydratase reactivase alpha subunit
MPLIAGIDIGNATTEVALASDDPQARAFVASGIVATTGMKGTRDNIAGTLAALEQALAKTPWSMSDVSRIYLNEAAPVIGDVAMETITETIISESTMIGHNPQTPGGVGVGVGTTIALGRLATLPAAQYAEGWIVLIDDAVDFLDAVWWLNEALDRGINVVAAILKKDDGVLVNNRLRKTLPVLTWGDYEDLLPEHPSLWCYRRQWQGQTLIVVANLSGESQTWDDDILHGEWQRVMSNYAQPLTTTLRPFEAVWWLQK